MNTSPKLRSGMDFYDALKYISSGLRLTKREWSNTNTYALMRNGYLMLRKSNGKYYQWIISEGDMIGSDWYVVDN